jgi:catechol 2,3-dioxygenase-like lactoylglutathione lyase family enzyme
LKNRLLRSFSITQLPILAITKFPGYDGATRSTDPMLGSAKVVTFIPTLDFEKSRPFYEETLGLRFLNDDGFALVFAMGEQETAGAESTGPGTVLRLVKVGTLLPHPFTVLGWNVSNLDQTVTKLAERAVTFERYPWMSQDGMGVWTAPGGARVAWFKDPDGNLLSVSQHAVVK